MAGEPVIKIRINGGQGGYLDEGSGPPLVLVVTPFVTAAMYYPARQALARRFRVITVELPDTAGHEPGGKTWEMEEYAQWVRGLLEEFDIRDAILVGHSNSGAIAILTGLICPERLAGIVLVGTTGASGSYSYLDTLAGLVACAPLEIRYALRLFPRFAYNIWHHTRNFFRQFVVSIRRDLRPQVRRLQVPTLVAWGALDYVMPMSNAKTLMRLLPKGELYVSGRGSHDWLVELADEFAAAVGAFAERLRTGARAAGAGPSEPGLTGVLRRETADEKHERPVRRPGLLIR